MNSDINNSGSAMTVDESVSKKCKRSSKKIWLANRKKRKEKYPAVTEATGITVTQYRSVIRLPEIQRQQLTSLGLGRIGRTRLLPDIPSVRRLVERLRHLVRVK
jgi:ribosomal protein L30